MESCEEQRIFAYITAYIVQFLCEIFVVKDKSLTSFIGLKNVIQDF